MRPSRYLVVQLRPWVAREVVYLPNGLMVGRYPFRLRSSPSACVVWLRALHQGYVPETAIHAFGLVKESFPDATLVLTGPDKGDGTLRRVSGLARGLRLANALELPGNIPNDQVPMLLDGGDVFLNTTRAESFGVSVMEAGACGLCIVSTDAGELPYLWRDGENALLVPVEDPEAMAAAVSRILRDGSLAAKLSSNARANAERFDWSVVLPQWEALLAGASRDG